MRKVIFLDRDGVINYEPGDYTYQVDKFNLLSGLFEALKKLKDQQYEFIVITNQGGISKGIYNHKDVALVHDYMKEEFSKEGIQLLDIYYCPHHSINEKCICRKPDSSMLERAIARYDVSKENAYFIGDSERDIQAAKKAGIKGILITKNEKLTNYLDQIN